MTSQLSPRDQRTLRWAAIGIGAYLVLFFGIQGLRALEKKRSDYLRLKLEAQNLNQEFKPYEVKAEVLAKLKLNYRMQPSQLNSSTLVADTSAAIQSMATSHQVLLGPMRESPPRPGARELAAIQLEGVGKVPDILSFLYLVPRLGFPVLIDSIQFTPDTTRPGMLKVSLSLVIVDYNQWVKEEVRNA